jgi:hypothetical protein
MLTEGEGICGWTAPHWSVSTFAKELMTEKSKSRIYRRVECCRLFGENDGIRLHLLCEFSAIPLVHEVRSCMFDRFRQDVSRLYEETNRRKLNFQDCKPSQQAHIPP